MYTLGVIFATLAGLEVFFLLLRGVGGIAGRKMLSYSDTPFLRHELAAHREKLTSKMEKLKETSTKEPKIAALIFLTLSILFFYFQ